MPDLSNHYLLSIARSGLARNITADHYGKIFEKVLEDKPSTDFAKNLAAITDVEADKGELLTVALAVAAIDGMEISNLTILCKFHQLDLRTP